MSLSKVLELARGELGFSGKRTSYQAIYRAQKNKRDRAASLFGGMASVSLTANTSMIPPKRPFQTEAKCFGLIFKTMDAATVPFAFGGNL